MAAGLGYWIGDKRPTDVCEKTLDDSGVGDGLASGLWVFSVQSERAATVDDLGEMIRHQDFAQNTRGMHEWLHLPCFRDIGFLACDEGIVGEWCFRFRPSTSPSRQKIDDGHQSLAWRRYRAIL